MSTSLIDLGTEARLAIGSYRLDTLDRIGEEDRFAVDLQAGETYVFTLFGILGTSAALADPELHLYDANDIILAFNDDFSGSNSQITYQALASGLHYLGASGYDGTTGSYVLTAGLSSAPVVIMDDFGATSDTAGAILAGQSIIGAIDHGGDRDWFAVEVTAGHRYVFSLDSFVGDGSEAALPDPLLGVYDGGGVFIASDDDGGENAVNARLVLKAAESGLLYLEARAYSSTNAATGRYALAVTDLGIDTGLLLIGSEQADTLNGDSGQDSIQGLEGDDSLLGGAGDDWLQGGAGDDVLDGGEGKDTLDGGADGARGDLVSYALAASGVSVDLALGLGGSPGETDVLIGIEHVIGSAHDDLLIGDSGDNRFQPGAGKDQVDGGAGRDELSYEEAAAAVVVDLASGTARGSSIGNDSLRSIESVYASAFDDVLALGVDGGLGVGRAGADTLLGGAGDDTLIGGSGADSLNGGEGFDLLSFHDDGADGAGPGTQGVSVDLVTGLAIDNWGATDSFSAIEAVLGSGLADRLQGDARDNVLSGAGGNDTLDGGAGSDVALYLGLYADYVIATDAEGLTTVTDLRADDGDEGTDTLSGIEILRFADGDRALEIAPPTSNTAPLFEVGSGKMTTDIGGGDDRARSIVLQADDRILVAGYSHNGTDYDLALARYNADGSLDRTFAGDGVLTAAVSAGDDYGLSLALQADGRILVASRSGGSAAHDVTLLRFMPDGSLDSSFAGDGMSVVIPAVVIPDSASGEEAASPLVLQPDGRILLAGSGDGFRLVRYQPDGSPDTSFAAPDLVDSADPDRLNPQSHFIALQADGHIVHAAQFDNGSNAELVLVRHQADGSLDTSFSGDGRLTIVLEDFFGTIQALAVQPDGRILLAGSDGNNFVLARYEVEGSPDAGFAEGGRLSIHVSALDEHTAAAWSLALQPDGRILVLGDSESASSIHDFALLRLHADGTPDRRFGSPTVLDSTRDHIENGAAILLDPDVRIVDPELLAQGHYAGATLTLGRKDGPQQEDRFLAAGNLAALTEGGDLVLAGTVIGKVLQNSAGLLSLEFGTAATPLRVDETLASIAYANAADAPPASVDIEWRFSDGNTGAQGEGGALVALGNTTVFITATNDAPVGTVRIEGEVRVGSTLIALHDLSDADGLGPIRYRWLADGVEIDSDGAGQYTPGAAEFGKAITVEALYTDGGGSDERIESFATAPVASALGAEGVSLTGQIYHWKSHALLADVEVQVSAPASAFPGERTTGDGAYAFDSLAPGQYGLTASRALGSAESGGVINSADALAALKIAVGRNPNADPDGSGPQSAPPVSPYQFIAADVNQDGKVNSADALAILKMAVKPMEAPAREWLFVAETVDFWDETAANGVGASTITRSAVAWERDGIALDTNADATLNLVALLKGDVDGNWAPPAGSTLLPLSHFDALNAAGIGPLAQWGVLPV